MSFIKKNIFILVLLVVPLVGFWQIAFLQNTMKWDMLDYFFPLRFYITECYKSNIFPFWNPYLYIGYPFHADPQSGAFYPIPWLISWLYEYNLYAVHFEFLFHIFFSGIGMYYLGKGFGMSLTAGLLTATSFQLSGIFIGNAQHLGWVISATWIPFILHYYFQLLKKASLLNAAKMAFFLFLCLTGGYLPCFIILGYFLFFVFCAAIIMKYRSKEIVWIKNFLRANVLTIIIFAGLSCVYLVSFYKVYPYITRSESVDLKTALLYPLTPQSFISFILPFSLAGNPEFFKTDASMSSGYFGIIAFALFLFSFFIKKDKTQLLFLVFGVFCLLTSLGEYSPLRKLLYQFVPLMDKFRFPSLFRIFSVLSFSLLAGFSFDKIIHQNFLSPGLKKILLLLVLIISGLFIFSFFRIDAVRFPSSFHVKDFQEFLSKAYISHCIIIQAPIQLGFLLLFFLLLTKKYFQNHLAKIILGLSCLDMIIAAQLNNPYTVIADEKPKILYNKIAQLPSDFPIPDNNVSIISQSHSGTGYLYPCWYNNNIFYKKIAFDGWGSFIFSNYEKVFGSKLQLALDNPLLYLTNDVRPTNEMAMDLQNDNFTKKTIFIDSANFSHPIKSDSLLEISNSITITEFNPNHLKADIIAPKNCFLTLLQNNYLGWKVKIDGKPVKHYTANYSFITVPVSKGKHSVDFDYFPEFFPLSFFISAISLILVVLYLFWQQFRQLNSQLKTL